jgi:hypothetical protein
MQEDPPECTLPFLTTTLRTDGNTSFVTAHMIQGTAEVASGAGNVSNVVAFGVSASDTAK